MKHWNIFPCNYLRIKIRLAALMKQITCIMTFIFFQASGILNVRLTFQNETGRPYETILNHVRNDFTSDYMYVAHLLSG